jgi:hypothetical protein
MIGDKRGKAMMIQFLRAPTRPLRAHLKRS